MSQRKANGDTIELSKKLQKANGFQGLTETTHCIQLSLLFTGATWASVAKEHMKLIQQVKIAHSFLHVMSKLFYPIIFSLSR